MEEHADAKWNLPGWRIEQKYSTDVLIGNWNEERRVFGRGDSHFGSTHRVDFKNYGKFLPDVTTRRKALQQHNVRPPTNYGLLKKLQQKWKNEAALEKLGTNVSTYNISFTQHPKELFTFQHHAIPKSLSCHFHPHNINKDLHLRGKQLSTAPEFPPTLAIPHNVPPNFPQSTILAI
ncbi:hypothetical protein pdam_00005976 [Pocillopora damicornis]|uniref:Uncharacterized protein n=1 Tax=Pocillopora damicornis TaxID=46731 RepID=A0A3M6TD81_POCDA|nr:hypothetical protein pdam_00005976 [Pocillopora damicornis]